jgi:hypothetical protein
MLIVVYLLTFALFSLNVLYTILGEIKSRQNNIKKGNEDDRKRKRK